MDMNFREAQVSMSEVQNDKPLIKLRLELMALDGEFFVRLQRLLDVLAVSTAGLKCVTDGPNMDFPSYWTMEFTKNARLPRLAAVAEAERWHLRTVVRDAMEITSAFLEECGSVCELLSQSFQRLKSRNSYVIPEDECNQMMKEEAKVFHKLNFPNKIKR
jgi:hypothetical protein